MGRFSMRTYLSQALYFFTNMCLPYDKPYVIKPNFILDSAFSCCTWLCYQTHAYHMFHASLPFCHHHVVVSCSYLDMPFSDSIDRFSTNMYIQYNMIVYKSQGINWHPQSDSLGDSPSKVDLFNFSIH